MSRKDDERTVRAGLKELNDLLEDTDEYVLNKSFLRKRHGKERKNRDRKISDEDYYRR